MIRIGFFKEMEITEHTGSIFEHLTDKINYDKEKVICYLESQKRFAGCPRDAIDCITGEIISPSFSVYTDDEYSWCDFLIYHIRKYNIKLPKGLIDKAMK